MLEYQYATLNLPEQRMRFRQELLMLPLGEIQRQLAQQLPHSLIALLESLKKLLLQPQSKESLELLQLVARDVSLKVIADEIWIHLITSREFAKQYSEKRIFEIANWIAQKGYGSLTTYGKPEIDNLVAQVRQILPQKYAHISHVFPQYLEKPTLSTTTVAYQQTVATASIPQYSNIFLNRMARRNFRSQLTTTSNLDAIIIAQNDESLILLFRSYKEVLLNTIATAQPTETLEQILVRIRKEIIIRDIVDTLQLKGDADITSLLPSVALAIAKAGFDNVKVERYGKKAMEKIQAILPSKYKVINYHDEIYPKQNERKDIIAGLEATSRKVGLSS
jgi:hypothetical protein